MSLPAVSIIIPCYNVEKYLDRCMRSVLNQTLTNIEIILVDDGSPDQVPIMCDKYAQHDIRIKVVHKKNGGLGFARNSGLEIATGKYIAFLDSDDYVSNDMYQHLYDEAVNINADAVFCNFYVEESNGRWWRSHEVDEYTEFHANMVHGFMLDMIASSSTEKKERKYYMSVWHAIYRRDIIENNKIRFLSEREIASEDLPFQIDFLTASHLVTYIPGCYYYYCANNTSLTATFKPEKYQRFRRLYRIICDKQVGDVEAQKRAKRFFIGYVRTQIHHLMLSDYFRKRAHLQEIVNDPIWNEIQRGYSPDELRNIYQKMMYKMILKKQIFLLMLLSRGVNLMRRLKH